MKLDVKQSSFHADITADVMDARTDVRTKALWTLMRH